MVSDKFQGLDADGLNFLWGQIKNYVDARPSGSGGVPKGTIVIWSGTADNIPIGWQICDGTNGTPDLRDKFVLGAGESHDVGETGGSEEVILTVDQMPSHSHYTVCNVNSNSSTGVNRIAFTKNATVENLPTGLVGSSQPHNNMPPYYSLCYIMKIAADPTAGGVTMDQINAAIQDAVADIQTEEVYSTEEVRIGTWIDGKPLYRRVLKGTIPTSFLNGTIEIMTEVDTMTMVRGIVVGSDGTTSFPNNIGTASDSKCFLFFNSLKQLVVKTNIDSFFGMPIKVVTEYTKTSDPTPASVQAMSLNDISFAAVTSSDVEVKEDENA